MKSSLSKVVPFLIFASLLFTGCAQDTGQSLTHGQPAESSAQQGKNVYKGKVVGKSNKAKSISIEVGKGADAKTVMLKFDENTKGVEHASPGHAAIIEYEMQGKDQVATLIKPKLAKLPAGVTEIKTAELKKMLDASSDLVLIDSRPASRYNEAHLPGAIGIPVPKLEETKGALLPRDKNKLLIFYCGGVTCGMSTDSAGMARKFGYTNVRVYLEGEPVWGKSGHPLYASTGFIEKGNIVLIDLRSPKKSMAGRIPRSVTIPYATLDDRLDEIPAKAPIVLYSDNDEEAMDALEDLRDEGFKKVSLVAGNYGGWVGKVESGPVATAITWKRILGKGEVAKADFVKVVEGQDSGAVILDVRTKDEVAAGKFSASLVIPLDEIGARMAELPKDKKIYIHCTTGARAEMAAKELLKNGYRAFFLVADVTCEGNDCAIED